MKEIKTCDLMKQGLWLDPVLKADTVNVLKRIFVPAAELGRGRGAGPARWNDLRECSNYIRMTGVVNQRPVVRLGD